MLDELIVTPRWTPEGLNRFIYYPDRLVRLPVPRPSLPWYTNLMNMFQTLQEPLFEGFVSGVLLEHWKPPRMPHEWEEDESVASFVSRRFNSQIADNLVSAVIHGIYAGDIDQLSAQALFGSARDLEGTGIVYGSLWRGLTRKTATPADEILAIKAHVGKAFEDLGTVTRRIPYVRGNAASASTYTFRRGIQQLTEALAHALKNSGKVDVRTSTHVQAVRRLENSETLEVRKLAWL